MSNPNCPFCGTKIIQIGATPSHVCGNEDCEMSSIPLRITTWEKRYVNQCKWVETVDFDGEVSWDTECGQKFCFIDGGPKDNNMNFCCYCGGELIEEVKDA